MVTGSLTRQWDHPLHTGPCLLSMAPSRPQQECCIQSSFPCATWPTFTFIWPCHTHHTAVWTGLTSAHPPAARSKVSSELCVRQADNPRRQRGLQVTHACPQRSSGNKGRPWFITLLIRYIFYKFKAKPSSHKKRLQLTLLQWSGTKPALSPRGACHGIFINATNIGVCTWTSLSSQRTGNMEALESAGRRCSAGLGSIRFASLTPLGTSAGLLPPDPRAFYRLSILPSTWLPVWFFRETMNRRSTCLTTCKPIYFKGLAHGITGSHNLLSAGWGRGETMV